MLDYLPAEIIAARMCRRFGALHLVEDAQSEARIALWRCSLAFDPARGALMQYAQRRIKGAVIEALRDEQHMSRRSSQPLGSTVLPIDAAASVPARDTMPTAEHIDVMRALGRLTDRQMHVITRRYMEDAEVAEVGAELGVDKSRVSVIAKHSLELMRNKCLQHSNSRH